MKVLITGYDGFVGKNLINTLKRKHSVDELLLYNRKNSFDDLNLFCNQADVVFHLAAAVRPEARTGYEDNIELTNRLIDCLAKNENKCPIMFASSIQAKDNNPYGISKRSEESNLISYGVKNDIKIYIFRFPNLFGKMSKPNYTSVISTFCYNTIMGMPITINDSGTMINFAFVEDVLDEVTDIVLDKKQKSADYIEFDDCYLVGLGELAYYMQTLKNNTFPQIDRKDDFYLKLKQTYNWYLKNYKMFNNLSCKG